MSHWRALIAKEWPYAKRRASVRLSNVLHNQACGWTVGEIADALGRPRAEWPPGFGPKLKEEFLRLLTETP